MVFFTFKIISNNYFLVPFKEAALSVLTRFKSRPVSQQMQMVNIYNKNGGIMCNLSMFSPTLNEIFTKLDTD